MSKNSHKCKPHSSDSESESDSSHTSTESSEDVKVFIKHKHSKTHKKEKKHSKKHSESEKEHCKKEKESDYESHSGSDSSNKEKCSFDEVYKYYKYRLLNDNSLMVGGSNAYISSYNNIQTQITQGNPVILNNDYLKYNIEHKNINAPFCVRESGIYIIFFIATTDEASQFTIFINGEEQILTTTGNNAGSGQTVFRSMIQLNENDTVLMRNWRSAAPSINLPLHVGGLLDGNNLTFLLIKIAALPNNEYKHISETWNASCLSRRKHYLFKKILEKMLCDKELMLKGFNVHGVFYNQNSQVVLTEAPIIFDSNNSVSGLSWSLSTPDQVKILEDGVYKLFFMANTNVSAQFSIFINGISIDSIIQGSNKGAGQISIRGIIELKKNDIIQVVNHTSPNSQIVISQNAGGIFPVLSVCLTIFKIAPLCKPIINDCKLNDYHKKCFEKFKCFLLSNKCLQLAGSPAYINVATTHKQLIDINSPIDWEVTSLKEHIYHKQSTTDFIINKDGIYDIFADLIASEPTQITLFINGIPDMKTTVGRDSGGNRTLMRQFIKLCKGDIITIRNYESTMGTLNTTLNSGGLEPGHPCFFMVFMLAQDYEDSWCDTKPKTEKKSDKKK